VARTYSVAVIAGDGIGQEVMPPAVEAVDACGLRFGFTVEWAYYDWGSARYRSSGRLMPEDGIERLRSHEAILFGAVGTPDIPDTTTLWGLLIPIRRRFDQYVNLRPVRHIAGMPSPLSDPDGIDIVVVRENVEGEYSDVGGRQGTGDDEYAIQESRFTRRGTRRIAAYAAELARTRSGRLTSATKSNGILHTMPFWDEQVASVVAGYPDVRLRPVLIDALAAQIVRRPQEFDVIVASNLFGDILSDLTAAVVGSLGVAASANLNPDRVFPSLFEPVHGSAPDIAGTGVANPIAAIYAAAMMLDHLGEAEAAAGLVAAADAVLRDGPRTPDLGGTAGTHEVAGAVLGRLRNERQDARITRN
jgi:tartrate dehydrogenase/decarboxylase / D-malate dehydrogenase